MAGEVGAVYMLPSGAFAFLASICPLGEWQLEVVDVHRACLVDGQQLCMSAARGERLTLAWHPHQWAQKVRARAAQDERVARHAAEEAAEKQERRDSWARAQRKVLEAGHGD